MEKSIIPIEIEIYEGSCVVHQTGERYSYPEDIGSICPWWTASTVWFGLCSLEATSPEDTRDPL